MQEHPRLDKAHFSITTLDEADREDAIYWRSRTPEERLAALELTRQTLYGYDPDTARLHRVLEIVERK
jgi:hypothetical protein